MKATQRTRTTNRIPILIVVIGMCLSVAVSARSQSQKELFTAIPKGSDLSDQQQKLVAAIRRQKTTADVNLVRINTELLARSETVSLTFSSDVKAEVSPTRVERKDGTLSWLGVAPGGGADSATFIVNGSQVTGSARVGSRLYSIIPIGAGVHAVVRRSIEAFPPDHPPGFKKLKESSPAKPQSFRDSRKDASPPVIRLLVAYTPAVAAVRPDVDSFIKLAVEETNQSYVNSQMRVRVELASTYRVKYTESTNCGSQDCFEVDLTRFRKPGDGFMDEIHPLRRQAKADVAILIFNNDAYCGLASAIMATAATAFAVVHHECATGYYSFGHELGHLQGARHNIEDDSGTSPFPYGHGYHKTEWRTIMSYNVCNCPRVQFWSNPSVKYQNSPMGTRDKENNATVLDETAATVATFRDAIGKP